MTSSPNLKLTSEFNDPELDPQERDEQAQRLIAKLKNLDEIDVDANLAEGTKSIGGTLVGLLTAEIGLANGKKLMGFLGDRLIDQTLIKSYPNYPTLLHYGSLTS